MRGRIEYLKSGYGFIKGDDSVSYFFIPSTMAEDSDIPFDKAKRNMVVDFVPVSNERGPRAESVHVTHEMADPAEVGEI
jgi:cold shock CspA family protein